MWGTKLQFVLLSPALYERAQHALIQGILLFSSELKFLNISVTTRDL